MKRYFITDLLAWIPIASALWLGVILGVLDNVPEKLVAVNLFS